MATLDEINSQIEEIKNEMMSEKSVSVDGKIKVNRRSNTELSMILGLLQAEKEKLENGSVGNSVVLRRGGFE